MGFYVRKSVSAGPFRFNLSSSGLGVSVGVPGFRVGSGPRGNYIALGRHGIYYRTTFGSGSGRQTDGSAPVAVERDFQAGNVPIADETGATPLTLAPTGSGDIVDQLNAAANHSRVAWFAGLVLLLCGAGIYPYGIAVWIIAVPVCLWLHLYDRAKRKAVLFYRVDDEPAAWFAEVVRVWPHFIAAERLWRVIGSGDVITTRQYKTNAGAAAVVQREPAKASLIGPSHLATNVAVPSIVAGEVSLHFLPDRLLIRQGKYYSDVAYRYLDVSHHRGQFAEGQFQVPRDTRVLDSTWTYVNVKGGPDRRYRSNPVVPIVEYGFLDMVSRNGLTWRILISHAATAAPVGTPLAVAPHF